MEIFAKQFFQTVRIKCFLDAMLLAVDKFRLGLIIKSNKLTEVIFILVVFFFVIGIQLYIFVQILLEVKCA